ncbi:MAG: type 4a pilus biogenesis protein PilO [Gaiellaceae bacterium]
MAVVVVLAGMAWFAIVAPHRADAGKLDRQIAAAQGELTVRQHADGSAAKSTSAAKVAEAGQSLLAMPSSTGMPQIVVELNRLANAAGVTLDGISPQPSTQVGDYQSVGLSVVIDGRYRAVQDFLHAVRTQVRVGKGGAVQASGRLFDVQGIDLEQTEPAPALTTTVTMQAFVFAPASETAPPPPTTTDSTTTTTAAGS